MSSTIDHRPEKVTVSAHNAKVSVRAHLSESGFEFRTTCMDYSGNVEAIAEVTTYSMKEFTITNADCIEWFESDGVLTIKHKGKPEAEDEADTDED